jgi:hypothetical protein
MKDLNRSYATFDQARTIVCVIELSWNSWLLEGAAPRLKRQPCKNLSTNRVAETDRAVASRSGGSGTRDQAGRRGAQRGSHRPRCRGCAATAPARNRRGGFKKFLHRAI